MLKIGDNNQKVKVFCSQICPTNRELKYRQRNWPKFPVSWSIPFLNEKYVHHLIFLRFYCKQMRTNILNNILYFYSASSWECKNTKDKYFEKIDKKTKDKYLEKKSWYFLRCRYLGLQKTRDYHGTVEFKLGGEIYFQANPNSEIQTKIGMIESSFGMIPVLGRYVESSVWDKTSDWDLLFLV